MSWCPYYESVYIRQCMINNNSSEEVREMGLHMQMNEPQELRAICDHTPNVLQLKALTLVCKTACSPPKSLKAHLLMSVEGNHPLNLPKTLLGLAATSFAWLGITVSLNLKSSYINCLCTVPQVRRQFSGLNSVLLLGSLMWCLISKMETSHLFCFVWLCLVLDDTRGATKLHIS